jgi:hypothetical protein
VKLDDMKEKEDQLVVHLSSLDQVLSASVCCITNISEVKFFFSFVILVSRKLDVPFSYFFISETL